MALVQSHELTNNYTKGMGRHMPYDTKGLGFSSDLAHLGCRLGQLRGAVKHHPQITIYDAMTLSLTSIPSLTSAVANDYESNIVQSTSANDLWKACVDVGVRLVLVAIIGGRISSIIVINAAIVFDAFILHLLPPRLIMAADGVETPKT